jgi:iron complex transport system substrate-binding protein
MSRFLAPLILALATNVFTPVLSSEFPVTLHHAYGETTIEQKPVRIATIGWMSQDVVLALGQVPVGIPLQNWGGDENGVLPWVAEAIAAKGASLPARYDDNAIPFELILALGPDVILAPYSQLSEEDYKRLSAIAPTVAWSKGKWQGSWQEITLSVSEALGELEKGKELIAETEASLAKIAAENPSFADKTFTFAWGDTASAAFSVYVGSDPRVQLMQDLGLKLSPGAAALKSDSFIVPVAFEQLETMDADVFITWQADQTELDAVLANPIVARFGPVASGHHIVMLDRGFVMATSAPSVLSIPWSLKKLVPELQRALAD